MKADPIVEYLARLELALGPVSSPRREQLLAEISDHLARSRAELANPSDADLQALLERIGPPEDIAAEETDAGGPPPALKRNRLVYLAPAVVIVVGAAIALSVAIFTPVTVTTAPGGPQAQITAKVRSVVALDPNTIRVYIDWTNSGKTGGQVTCSIEATVRNQAGASVNTEVTAASTHGDIKPGETQHLHRDIGVNKADAQFVKRSDIQLIGC